MQQEFGVVTRFVCLREWPGCSCSIRNITQRPSVDCVNDGGHTGLQSGGVILEHLGRGARKCSGVHVFLSGFEAIKCAYCYLLRLQLRFGQWGVRRRIRLHWQYAHDLHASALQFGTQCARESQRGRL